MPQWGRPPGPQIGRSSRRDLVRRLEQSAAVQELDGSHEEGAENDGRNSQGAKSQQREQQHYATPEDGSDDGEEYGLQSAYSDPTLAWAMQLAMQDDDEWLVENALERIRQSQRQGKAAVKLSQRELAALERSRLQTQHGSGRRPSATSGPVYEMRTSDPDFATPARPASSASQQPLPNSNLSNPYPQPYPTPPNYSDSSTSRPSSSASTAMHQPVPQWMPRSRAPSSSYIPPPPPFPFPPFPGTSFAPYDPHHYAAMMHQSASALPESVYQQMYSAPASNPVSPQPTHACPSSPKRASRRNSSDSNNSDNGVQVNSNNNKNGTGSSPDTSPSLGTSEKNKKSTTQVTKKKIASTSNGAVVGRRKRKTGR